MIITAPMRAAHQGQVSFIIHSADSVPTIYRDIVCYIIGLVVMMMLTMANIFFLQQIFTLIFQIIFQKTKNSDKTCPSPRVSQDRTVTHVQKLQAKLKTHVFKFLSNIPCHLVLHPCCNEHSLFSEFASESLTRGQPRRLPS